MTSYDPTSLSSKISSGSCVEAGRFLLELALALLALGWSSALAVTPAFAAAGRLQAAGRLAGMAVSYCSKATECSDQSQISKTPR